MTLVEKNKLIVDVLLKKYNWCSYPEGYADLEDHEFVYKFADGQFFQHLGDLKFDSDSNWQWLCVKRIAEIEEVSILKAFHLLESFYPFVESVSTKEHLFEAIVNYTKHLCNEHIQS